MSQRATFPEFSAFMTRYEVLGHAKNVTDDDGQVDLCTICEVMLGERGGRVMSDHDSRRQTMTRQTASSHSQALEMVIDALLVSCCST